MQIVDFGKLSKEEQNLIISAKEAGSRFLNKKGTRHVGAALLGKNGVTYLGTSIRRTNGSSSTCAERMALDKALFEKCYGFNLLAIVGFYADKRSNEVISPCGTCRQIWSEAETYDGSNSAIPMLFANEDFSKVIKTDSREILPLSYEANNYKK